MPFTFKFTQTSRVDPELIRDTIKEGLRTIAKNLKEIKASVEVEATINAK